MNNTISSLKVLQKTTTSGLGEVAFLYYTRRLQLPPTTFLFLWLLNKLQSAVVEGTHTQQMNNTISYLKGLQTIPSGSGALALFQYTGTLQLPPTTFLFMWLLNKLQSAVVEGTHTQQMNNRISYLKGLQRTKPSGLGALASIIPIPTRS